MAMTQDLIQLGQRVGWSGATRGVFAAACPDLEFVRQAAAK
jgi:hypothetical protein